MTYTLLLGGIPNISSFNICAQQRSYRVLWGKIHRILHALGPLYRHNFSPCLFFMLGSWIFFRLSSIHKNIEIVHNYKKDEDFWHSKENWGPFLFIKVMLSSMNIFNLNIASSNPVRTKQINRVSKSSSNCKSLTLANHECLIMVKWSCHTLPWYY